MNAIQDFSAKFYIQKCINLAYVSNNKYMLSIRMYMYVKKKKIPKIR